MASGLTRNQIDSGCNAQARKELGEAENSGAPNQAPSDPKLAKIIDAWPKLPKAIKRAMLALVE